MTLNRDEFTESIKQNLAKRVSNCCSNPCCGASTSGPHTESGKVLNIGVAAHITSASSGGPRYDSTLTSKQRTDIANGIWLCQTCAKLVDNDEILFSVEVLREWKITAEQNALDRIGKPMERPEDYGQILDKFVAMDYPDKIGIIRKLEDEGYRHAWIRANDQHEWIETKGWEPFIQNMLGGKKYYLKINDVMAVGGYVIFLKRKI